MTQQKWEPGKKVRIINCFRGHGFEIGEVVTIDEFFVNSWACVNDKGQRWFIIEGEAELIDDTNPIRTYVPSEELPIWDFLSIFIYDKWNHNYGTYRTYSDDDGHDILELHTGGWSDNEAIMDDILANPYLVNGPMTHIRWEIGGHYWFKFN